MTELLVCRDNVPFQGRTLRRGDRINSVDFPSIDRFKWAQLIDQRIFDLADQPGADLSRAIAERDRARTLVDRPPDVTALASDTVPTVKPARTCPGCGGPLVKKLPTGPGRYPKLCPGCKTKE